MDAIADFDLKIKYDDTVEMGKFIYSGMPFETNVIYQKHKKILVVSPRDLVIIGGVHRISKDEAYIISKAIDIPSYPE